MNIIWKSNLSSKLKRNLFRDLVDTVFVYDSITFTITSTLEKKNDGAYTHAARYNNTVLERSRYSLREITLQS